MTHNNHVGKEKLTVTHIFRSGDTEIRQQEFNAKMQSIIARQLQTGRIAS